MNKLSKKTNEVKRPIRENDRSIGEKAPGTPFIVVALTYVGILTLVCVALAALISLGR